MARIGCRSYRRLEPPRPLGAARRGAGRGGGGGRRVAVASLRRRAGRNVGRRQRAGDLPTGSPRRHRPSRAPEPTDEGEDNVNGKRAVKLAYQHAKETISAAELYLRLSESIGLAGSQRAVAEALGIPRGRLSEILSGKRNITAKIAERLGWTISYTRSRP